MPILPELLLPHLDLSWPDLEKYPFLACGQTRFENLSTSSIWLSHFLQNDSGRKDTHLFSCHISYYPNGVRKGIDKIPKALVELYRFVKSSQEKTLRVHGGDKTLRIFGANYFVLFKLASCVCAFVCVFYCKMLLVVVEWYACLVLQRRISMCFFWSDETYTLILS